MAINEGSLSSHSLLQGWFGNSDNNFLRSNFLNYPTEPVVSNSKKDQEAHAKVTTCSDPTSISTIDNQSKITVADSPHETQE